MCQVAHENSVIAVLIKIDVAVGVDQSAGEINQVAKLRLRTAL